MLSPCCLLFLSLSTGRLWTLYRPFRALVAFSRSESSFWLCTRAVDLLSRDSCVSCLSTGFVNPVRALLNAAECPTKMITRDSLIGNSGKIRCRDRRVLNLWFFGMIDFSFGTTWLFTSGTSRIDSLLLYLAKQGVTYVEERMRLKTSKCKDSEQLFVC